MMMFSLQRAFLPAPLPNPDSGAPACPTSVDRKHHVVRWGEPGHTVVCIRECESADS